MALKKIEKPDIPEFKKVNCETVLFDENKGGWLVNTELTLIAQSGKDLLDALIEARKEISKDGIFEDGPTVRKIDKALLKAGCRFIRVPLLFDFFFSGRARSALLDVMNRYDLSINDSLEWFHGFQASEFLKIRGCGPKTVKEIIENLSDVGIQLDKTGIEHI
jgi:hypothetical protein